MSMKYYYSTGNRRDVPKSIHQLFSIVAVKLQQKGYMYRYGGISGIEKFFAGNAISNKELVNIKQITQEHLNIASLFYPEMDKLSKTRQKQLGKIVNILLGNDCNTPISFLITHTKNGVGLGDTYFAINVAKGHGIPIFDCYYNDVLQRLRKMVDVKVELSNNLI